MCVQYRGGFSVPWGVFSTVGGYLEYHGGCSVLGGYLEYCGGVQYRGGYHDARGGYHEYHGGCSVPWGKSLLLFEYPTVLNTPHGTHDIPPRYSNFKG